MLWVRLDCSYYDHRKLVAAGPLAELLWVRALAWANRNRTPETDGVVPTGVLGRLCDFTWRTTLDGDSVSPSELAAALVREGLWVEVPGGYLIHDYSTYQKSLEELDELAAKRSAAGKKGANARWGDGKSHSPSEANGMAGAGQTDAPSSGPDRSTSSSVSDDTQEGSGTTDDDVPAVVWEAFARLKAKLESEAGRPVRNYGRWSTSTIGNAKAEHGERAARWLSEYILTPNELAAGLVDGKPSRYWTRRIEAS